MNECLIVREQLWVGLSDCSKHVYLLSQNAGVGLEGLGFGRLVVQKKHEKDSKMDGEQPHPRPPHLTGLLTWTEFLRLHLEQIVVAEKLEIVCEVEPEALGGKPGDAEGNESGGR